MEGNYIPSYRQKNRQFFIIVRLGVLIIDNNLNQPRWRETIRGNWFFLNRDEWKLKNKSSRQENNKTIKRWNKSLFISSSKNPTTINLFKIERTYIYVCVYIYFFNTSICCVFQALQGQTWNDVFLFSQALPYFPFTDSPCKIVREVTVHATR